MAGPSRWYFDKKTLADSPSRKCGIEADEELSYRQQAANLIQDMGQRLRVTQLCINTAIVYMHRFYVFHSITKFRKSQIAACALFLAAKVEEQPRKLECVVRTVQQCLHQPINDPKAKEKFYQEQANLLVKNENIMLQTLGFDIAIEHPHTFVVKCCQLVRASKDLAQTCYFMATNSLHLTTMCLQYKPTIVACVCIHLASKWSNWEIPKSSEGKDWFYYVDPDVSFEKIEELTAEFLAIHDKCPSRLKRKMILGTGSDHNLSPNYDSMAGPSNSSSYSNKVESRSSSASKSDLFSSSNVKSDRCTQVPSSSSTTALNHTASSSAASSRISPAPSSSVPHKQGDKYTHSYSVYKEKKEQERREEQERKESERRIEQERREQEKREFERLEKERLEREEQERKELERKEQERKEQERREQERREQERREQERREQERRDWERRDQERREQERIRLENERRETERRETERREAERREAERREAERREAERREAERREAERRELERREAERREAERREIERREAEKREAERREAERREAEHREQRERELERELAIKRKQEADLKLEQRRKIEMAEAEARKRTELERNERRERESEMQIKKEKDRREKHSHHKNKSKNHPPHSHQQPQSILPVHPDHITDSTSFDHNNAASDSNGGDAKRPPIKIKVKLGNNQKSEPEPTPGPGLKLVIPKSKLAHDPSSQSFNASSGSRKRKNSYESGPGSIGKKQNCT